MSAEVTHTIVGAGDAIPWAERRNCGCALIRIGEGVVVFPCAGHRAGVEAAMKPAEEPPPEAHDAVEPYHCGKDWCPTREFLRGPDGCRSGRDFGPHSTLGDLVESLVSAADEDARVAVLDRLLIGCWGFALADIRHADRHLLLRYLRGLVCKLAKRLHEEVQDA